MRHESESAIQATIGLDRCGSPSVIIQARAENLPKVDLTFEADEARRFAHDLIREAQRIDGGDFPFFMNPKDMPDCEGW